MRLVDADDLLAEYDRQHEGEPGKARKLIEDAPTVDAVPLSELIELRDRLNMLIDKYEGGRKDGNNGTA